MQGNGRSILALFAVVGLVLHLILPSLANADGGPILSDPELWAMIDEGQQIAVVHLQQEGTARVDLFISLADRSGQSHQVTFFLPLGVGAADLSVVEETSLAFDEALTEEIDRRLKAEIRREPDYRYRVRVALLLGSVTTHATWISLAAAPLLMSGWPIWGGLGAVPLATFETPSSQVAVYDIDSETDLSALIETTGLDPKVKETLAALQGQQIAVVKLQTQPLSAEEGATYPGESTGQPGIHLGWRSTLVPDPAGATYNYPLGTGKAWASPIELTRVYVISPPDLDFTVDYPQLGDDLSGLGEEEHGELAWKIEDAESPAFAVDEAYGEFGHIWRATYVKSNSAQDLVVTSQPGPSQEMERTLRRIGVQGVIEPLTWYLAPLAGLAAWLTAWRVVMRRRLAVPYRWLHWKLYGDAFLWAVLYALTSLVALPVVGLWSFFLLAGCALFAVPAALPLLLILLGLINAFLFSGFKAEKLQVTRRRAFGAYMLAVLMANVLYLAFAVVYSAIVGAI
jgi:hypothetical protein